MDKKRVAVPSLPPGDLSSSRSDHFGHCEFFTIVDFGDDQILGVSTLANEKHEPGGCLQPVSLLQQHGVNAIIVGGMGLRPLQAFHEVGIEVYFAGQGEFPDVRSALDAVMKGRLSVMTPGQVCQGHGKCHQLGRVG